MTRQQQQLLALGGAALLIVLVQQGILSVDALLFLAVLVPSVILHEVSHGAVALLCGDDTAKRAGRLTLNPISHIDPIGTLVLPAVLVLATGSAFGYAKPVPVNPSRMRSPRNHNVVVALAGPAVNISLAVLAAVVLHAVAPATLGAVGALLGRGLFVDLGSAGFSPVARLVFELGVVNVILAAFNLIPLPPLDGSAVVERLLPARFWPPYLRLRQYSMLILMVVIFMLPRSLGRVFGPALKLWSNLL